MKILFLSNRLPHANVAGGHRLIHQRMRMLAERGHQIGLASFMMPNAERFVPGLRDMLCELETVTYSRRQVTRMHDYLHSSLPAIFWKNHSPRLLRLVGEMVARTGYEAVVAEFSEMGLYLCRNPYLPPVRKIVSCHRCLSTTFTRYVHTSGVPPMLRLKSAHQLRVLRTFEFDMYRAMDHVITLTAEDRFTLLHRAPELRISIVPPGIDCQYLQPAPEAPAEPVVMMSGYLRDKSNSDAALWFARKVWPDLSRRHPELRFYIVGAEPDAQVRRLGRRDRRIVVTGEVDDLRPLRAKAMVFVNPVRLGSGLRIKVLEAMASGLPVVSTSLGVAGIPAQNGVNCFVADTPALIVQSIDWLLSDASLRRTMGAAARQLVCKQYEIHSTTSALERAIKETIEF